MKIRRGEYLATIIKERLRGQTMFTYYIYLHQNGEPTTLLYTGSDPELANCTRTAKVHVDFLAAASEEKSSVVEAGNTCLDQRKLVTSFLFGPRVIGWRCSLCRKLFCVTIHDGTPDDCPPDYVRWDFERHSCLLNLHTEFEHKQLRS